MARKKSYFTVTEKGQVTIPGAIRKTLGIEPGTQVTFEVRGDKVVMSKSAGPHNPIAEVYGILGRHLDTDKIIARLRGPKE